MKASALIFTLVVLIGRPSYAVNSFNFAYTDTSGVEWSHTLEGGFSNRNEGCNHFDGRGCSVTIDSSDDSDAWAACEAIGAKLPTREQFMRLVYDFDHNGYRLTPKGVEQMRTAFGNDFEDYYWFWAATVPGYMPQSAHEFGMDYNPGNTNDRRSFNSVRCVITP